MATPPPVLRFRRGGVMAALLGVGRVARGRPDGIALFDDTPRGFMVSLLPVLSFLLISTLTMPADGDSPPAGASFFAILTLLLTPLVLSEWLAGIWGREAAWLRFATAFNWCQWMMPVAVIAGLLVANVMVSLGLPQSLSKRAAIAVVFGYGLWLEFFLARHALVLTRNRSIILVFAINVGTAALAVAASLIADALTR